MSSPAPTADGLQGLIPLRPYQLDGIARVRAALEAVARVVFVLATGGGKTVIASWIVAAALSLGSRVLFLAHRREIIKQSFCKLIRNGIPIAEVGIIMAGVPSWDGEELFPSDLAALSDDELWHRFARRRPGARVQVASLDSLRGRATKPLADLVIVDEAHRSLAASYTKLLEGYPDAAVLGLTATPYRADGRGLGDLFEDLVVVASPRRLIEEGFLVEPEVWTVPVGARPDLSGVKIKHGDYVAGELAAAVDRAELVGDIVEHWKRHAEGVRTVAFACSVEHSRHIARRFLEAGVPAEHLDGETPNDQRDATLARLNRGETLVVSNCALLTEGWDCLDSETEVMTARGWARAGEVRVGDLVHALDPKTHALRLVPAQDVGRRAVRADERMVTLRSQHVDVRVTEGHRFYVAPPTGGALGARTGAEMVTRTKPYALPMTGQPIDFAGVPLSDDELRFVAWFMTDGGFERNGASVVITQSKAFHHEIRALLDRLGLDYTERVRQNMHGFVTKGPLLPVHVFQVPKGTRTGTLARRGWFERFALYVDKNVSPSLSAMTRDQFRVFWAELLKGDGEQLDKSGWLWCDRKRQVDAYTRLAIERGFSASYSERVTAKGKTVYRVSVREKQWISSRPTDPRAAKIVFEPARPSEEVWCVTNELGTLVTRRRGKIVILGNCPPVKCCILARPTKSLCLVMQCAGRILRPWEGQRAIILDHAGCMLEHGLPQDDREFSLEGDPKGEKLGGAAARECPKCGFVVPPAAPQCAACGFIFPPAPAGTPPEEIPGQLVNAHAAKGELDLALLTSLEAEWRKKNAKRVTPMKPGWILYRFKEKTGRRPPRGYKLPSLAPEQLAERAKFEALRDKGLAPAHAHAALARLQDVAAGPGVSAEGLDSLRPAAEPPAPAAPVPVSPPPPEGPKAEVIAPKAAPRAPWDRPDRKKPVRSGLPAAPVPAELEEVAF